MSRIVRLAIIAFVLGAATAFAVLFALRFVVSSIEHGGFW